MIKNLLLLTIACCLFSFGCRTVYKTASPVDLPKYVQKQLSSVKFDSSFNIISPNATYADDSGAYNTYAFVAKIKDSFMTGNLVKMTSQVNFTPTVQKFRIYYLLVNMCCHCGHNPIHCATTRQGMIDTAAKYHCSGWSAGVVPYMSSN